VQVQDGPALSAAVGAALARPGPTLVEILAEDFRAP
jgi:hypothetical protein